jgi:hypothetical protein
MTQATSIPPTFVEDYLKTILSSDALAKLEKFRRRMEAVEKISNIPSVVHLLAPTS